MEFDNWETVANDSAGNPTMLTLDGVGTVYQGGTATTLGLWFAESPTGQHICVRPTAERAQVELYRRAGHKVMEVAA